MTGDASPLERARARALRLLAGRPRTTAQIRERLVREGLGEAANEVLEWLGRLGYLDDAAYARDRARGLVAPGRLGPRRAEQRLVAAGIPDPEAREAVDEALRESAVGAGAEGAEVVLCRALAEKRLRSSRLDSLDEQERARLARWLLARGFGEEAVAQVVGISLVSGD